MHGSFEMIRKMTFGNLPTQRAKLNFRLIFSDEETAVFDLEDLSLMEPD